MKIAHTSPSRLKVAQKCDFKYFLQYEWGWGDELFTYTFCSEFGSSVHYTLEEYAASKGAVDYKAVYHKHIMDLKPFSDDMRKAPSKARASFFMDYTCEGCPFFQDGNCGILEKEVNAFEGCPRKLYNEGLQMVETAIERYGEYFNTGIKSAENPNGRVIGIETPTRIGGTEDGENISFGLDVDGEPVKMNGFIDLLVEYDEETLLVVDYKTGYSIPSYQDFTEDLQPRMYSLAAKMIFPQYKYCWVQFDYFRSSTPIEYAFSADDDERTRREVVKEYNRIKGTRTIQRRGHDHYCKYLCNRPFCDKKWEELKAGVDGSNPKKK